VVIPEPMTVLGVGLAIGWVARYAVGRRRG
jgi:hypothetical protein